MANMVYISLSAKTPTTKSFVLIKIGFDEHLGCLIIKRSAESYLEDWKSLLDYVLPVIGIGKGYIIHDKLHITPLSGLIISLDLDIFSFLSEVLSVLW